MKKPQESDSQLIGKRAGRAFQGRLPDGWSVTDLAGDTDYGLDYMVQVSDGNGQISFNFYLQLKGTTTPNFVNNNTEVSHQFNSSTLNYYRETESAVMVAVVDLSASNLPRNCPVYYKWLDEDHLDAIKEKRERNDTVTIRVSKADEIDESLDVWPFYKKRLSGRESLIEFRRAVEKQSTTPISDIHSLAKAINEKPILLLASRDDTGAPWITNPADHAAGRLNVISDEISANRLTVAERKIHELEGDRDLTAHERAELFSLRGNIETLRGEDKTAHESFKNAYTLYPESRYKISFYESTFRLGGNPEENVLKQYIENLDSTNYKECVLKAKCLVVIGEPEEALRELDNYSATKNVIARLMVCTISGNIEAFDEISSSIDLSDLSEQQKFLYHALVGRRQFFKAIRYDYDKTGNEIIPAKGRREYDFELLKKSLENIEAALEQAKNKGYPVETYLLLDVAVSLLSIYNREKYLISYLEGLLIDRPKSIPVIDSLVKLKFNTRKYEDVIDLVGAIDDQSPDHISLLISSHYHLGRKAKVVSLMEVNKTIILNEKPQNYEALICIAAQCAYETAQEDKEQEYLSYIQGFEKGGQLSAVYDYVKLCNESPEKRGEANMKLYEKYLSLGKPVFVADQLFSNLDVQDPGESKIVTTLAEEILLVRELYPEEYKVYAFSLLHNSMWQELEELCKRVEEASGLDNLWSLLKAAALDGLGHSKDALDLLDCSISADKRSFERAEQYANLCVSLGFFAKAAEKLENLLDSSSTEQQLSILQSLMFIYSADEEPSERLIPALLRIGRLVDQDDELQEGRYLVAFLILTARRDVDVKKHLDDFRKRLDTFLGKYPDSKILKAGHLPVDSGRDELLHEIRKIAEISDEQVNTWKRNRNLIRSRKLPVPFALLSGFLDDVSDVFSAWVFGKYYGPERKEYQLVHSRMMSNSELESLTGSNKNVVLDETSLLLLNDLDLLEVVLSHMSGIVINKATYAMFSKASHAVMGSMYSSIPREIVHKVGNNLEKVILKGSGNPGDSLIEQYSSILENCDACICTEDLHLSELMRLGGYKTINSLNIIDKLEAKGIITKDRSILAIEMICSFGISNVALSVEHIVSSLDFNLGSLENRNILDTGFGAVFNAVFFRGRNTYEAVDLLTEIFSGYLNKHGSEVDIDCLGELVNVWMVRYPDFDRLELVSLWFVISSVFTIYIPEGEVQLTGKGQSKLWALTKKLTMEVNEAYNLRVVLSSISDVTLRLTAQKASDVYDRVKTAFVDGSSEAEHFSSIYTAAAINKRIAEAEK